jgi:hypothetical protein
MFENYGIAKISYEIFAKFLKLSYNFLKRFLKASDNFITNLLQFFINLLQSLNYAMSYPDREKIFLWQFQS